MKDEVLITAERGLVSPFAARVRAVGPLVRLWTRRDLRARYRESLLRSSWSLIQPVVMLATYGWVLSTVLRVGQEPIPYLSFAWAGLVVYTFAQQCLVTGVGSIVDSGFVVSKVYFPREVLPLSVIGVGIVDLVPTTGLLLAVSWIQIGPPTMHILGALIGLAIIVVATAAATVASAALAVFRRDVRHAMPLITRVMFILSPVMYSIDQFPSAVRRWSDLNPLTVAIEAVRDGTLRHRWPSWGLLAAHLALALLALAGSMLLTRRLERRMSDNV